MIEQKRNFYRMVIPRMIIMVIVFIVIHLLKIWIGSW